VTAFSLVLRYENELTYSARAAGRPTWYRTRARLQPGFSRALIQRQR